MYGKLRCFCDCRRPTYADRLGNNLFKPQMYEEGAEADLCKLLILDLGMGSVILSIVKLHRRGKN